MGWMRWMDTSVPAWVTMLNVRDPVRGAPATYAVGGGPGSARLVGQNDLGDNRVRSCHGGAHKKGHHQGYPGGIGLHVGQGGKSGR
jgi:hypothetical protein